MTDPSAYCDWECALVNGCDGAGGAECSCCGKWFCTAQEGDGEGLCGECAKDHAFEDEEEEENADEEEEDGE